MKPLRSRRSKQSGVALVLAIGILAALVALTAALAADQHMEAKARMTRLQIEKARVMAQAGIQMALAELSSQSASVTLTTDTWNTIGGSPDQPGSIKYDVGTDSFRVQILDACSLIDLNSAPATQLQNLPLTQEQVDSFMDWREAGQTARSDGAKDDYYLNLTNPYLTKTGPLDSYDELLQVKNFTPQTLYDTAQNLGVTTTLTQGDSTSDPSIFSVATVDANSPNTSPAGTTKLYVNSGGVSENTLLQRGIPRTVATAIAARRNWTSLSQILALPGAAGAATAICDNLTVHAGSTVAGLIDLNTATLPVLNSLPGMQQTLAQSIINQQQTGFQSLGQLFTLSGVTAQSVGTMIDNLTVATQTFIVRSAGTSGASQVCLQAVVDISTGTPVIKKIYEPPFPDMPDQWSWYPTATDTVLVDSSQIGAGQ